MTVSVHCSDSISVRWGRSRRARDRLVKLTYLHQQRHGAALIDLQDLSVLGSQQDVTVAQRDGSDGRVVLQQQPCSENTTDHLQALAPFKNTPMLASPTFRGRRQGGPLDGVRFQTSLKHVVPKLHDAVFPPRHKTLDTGSRNPNKSVVMILF